MALAAFAESASLVKGSIVVLDLDMAVDMQVDSQDTTAVDSDHTAASLVPCFEYSNADSQDEGSWVAFSHMDHVADQKVAHIHMDDLDSWLNLKAEESRQQSAYFLLHNMRIAINRSGC